MLSVDQIHLGFVVRAVSPNICPCGFRPHAVMVWKRLLGAASVRLHRERSRWPPEVCPICSSWHSHLLHVCAGKSECKKERNLWKRDIHAVTNLNIYTCFAAFVIVVWRALPSIRKEHFNRILHSWFQGFRFVAFKMIPNLKKRQIELKASVVWFFLAGCSVPRVQALLLTLNQFSVNVATYGLTETYLWAIQVTWEGERFFKIWQRENWILRVPPPFPPHQNQWKSLVWCGRTVCFLLMSPTPRTQKNKIR